jgi:hypothetical protein
VEALTEEALKNKNSPRYCIAFSDLDTKLFLVYLERIRPLLWRHHASVSAGRIVTKLRAARAAIVAASKSTYFPSPIFRSLAVVGPK